MERNIYILKSNADDSNLRKIGGWKGIPGLSDYLECEYLSTKFALDRGFEIKIIGDDSKGINELSLFIDDDFYIRFSERVYSDLCFLRIFLMTKMSCDEELIDYMLSTCNSKVHADFLRNAKLKDVVEEMSKYADIYNTLENERFDTNGSKLYITNTFESDKEGAK